MKPLPFVHLYLQFSFCETSCSCCFLLDFVYDFELGLWKETKLDSEDQKIKDMHNSPSKQSIILQSCKL